MKIRKGDKVKVLLGKDRGKTGIVQLVLAKRRRVFVEGVNQYIRHVRKMQNVEGGIIDIPKTMDLSNVVLICPNCNKPTKIGFKVTADLKTRICKKCKKEIKYAKT